MGRADRMEGLRCRPLLIALLASAASFATGNAPAAEDPCAVKLFRWQEDCRDLRDREASLGAAERLRYIPLNTSGSVWLTLGAEYRLKTEYFNAPNFALKPPYVRYTAIGQRALLHADCVPRRVFGSLCSSAQQPKPDESPSIIPSIAAVWISCKRSLICRSLT